jgi:hypothetical protein
MKMDQGVRNTLAIVAIVLAVPAAAVVPNQTDDFQDGTTQGWVVAPLGQPHPFPPANVATGGPAGANDNYLLLTSVGGSGPGSRLVTLNLSQWAGNYTAAGVAGISLDLRNLGNTDLHIRLLFEDPTTAPPTNVAMTEDVYLPAGGGWITVAYGINAASLIPVLGNVPTLLTNVTAIRIFSGEGAVFPPDPIAGQLGVDNVHALGAVATETETWSSIKAMFE